MRNSAKTYIRTLIALVTILVPMAFAAGLVCLVIGLIAGARYWHWYQWIIFSPFLYYGWLLLYMVLSAWTCSQLGKRNPKPRFHATKVGGPTTRNDLGLITAVICYRRADILSRLPLVSTMGQSEALRDLTFRAYSPSVSIGKNSVIAGRLEDPDLTTVGESVMLGSNSIVVAHSISSRRDGTIVYISAPIKIGNRATVGGSARIAMGVVLGDDCVVEPGAVVEPFTNIPAMEVWGGNPAVFRRTLEGEKEVPQKATADAVGAVRTAPHSELTSYMEDARQVVCSALKLAPDAPAHDLSVYGCERWDSMGQMAIASAVFDRYGTSIPPSEIYRIKSLEDIARFLAEQSRSPREQTETVALPDARAEIPQDPEILPILDPVVTTRKLAERFSSPQIGAKPISVTVAASFTAQQIASSAELWGRAFGFDFTFSFAGFNQIEQTLLNPGSEFTANNKGVNLVLLRPEDLRLDSSKHAQEQLDQLTAAIGYFGTNKPPESHFLVGALPPAVSSSIGADPQLVEDLRKQWRTRLSSLSGVEIFEFGHVVENLGLVQAYDRQNEMLSRAPFSSRLYQDLGIQLARRIVAFHRSPVKVIAVDCDNTLWGGVLGEVGFDGIEVGLDGPGRGFQFFQKRLKALQERGVLLAIISKNEPDDVHAVFERHPGMVLRPADIAAWRVNWRHKSENLRELAGELNLSLNSFVFLDDDAAVRMEVEARAPEVHVVPLSADPSNNCEALDRLWLFDGASATGVDLARTRMVKDESARQEERSQVASLEEFLIGLQLEVHVARAAERDLPRVSQLTLRTNQFNTSLRRRTVEETRNLADRSSILIVQAQDRFGDYGLVGAAILGSGTRPESLEIETLLMSCRALGRGVEDALLSSIAKWAEAQSKCIVEAPFISGPRNGLARDFLGRTGFQEYIPGRWEIQVRDIPPLPQHVRLSMEDLSI